MKYGFNAFLLFEVESSTSYSKQEIGGYLDVIIKKIPSVEISGTANLSLTDEESVISSSLSFIMTLY